MTLLPGKPCFWTAICHARQDLQTALPLSHLSNLKLTRTTSRVTVGKHRARFLIRLPKPRLPFPRLTIGRADGPLFLGLPHRSLVRDVTCSGILSSNKAHRPYQSLYQAPVI